MYDHLAPPSILKLELIPADYQDNNALVPEHELNLVRRLTEAIANAQITVRTRLTF